MLGYIIYAYPAMICMSLMMVTKPLKRKRVVITIEDKLDISCKVDVEPSCVSELQFCNHPLVPYPLDKWHPSLYSVCAAQ